MKIPLTEDRSGKTIEIVGRGGPIDVEREELFLGNAGTAMRPLASVLCAGKGEFVLDGVPRMRERSIIDLVDGLQQVSRPRLFLAVTCSLQNSRACGYFFTSCHFCPPFFYM